jgi:hypothetical protein
MSVCATVKPFTGSLRIAGSVRQGDSPVRCFVRLLDRNRDFVAEVRADQAGSFTFYAIPGDWTLRTISQRGSTDSAVRLVDADILDIALAV